MRIIPEKFTSVILEKIETLESLEGRDVTSNELVSMTRGFRYEIDGIFYRKNGKNSEKEKSTSNGSANQAKGGKGKSSKGGKGSTVNGQVNAVTRSQSQQQSAPAQDKANQHNSGQGQTQPYNSSGSRKNKRGKGRQNNNHNNGQQPLRLEDCKLCKQRSHCFDQCPLFKPHERIIASEVCHCPMMAFHLPKFCPIKTKN